MPVSEAFQVAKGGFTSLAGQVDHVARAAIAAIRRQLAALSADVTTAEAAIDSLELYHSTNLTLADDQAAYIEFSADATRGLAVIAPNTAAAGSAIVSFRVQTSAFASLVASVGATVTVGTGTLAGTTGTDTHLTIRANTANNRLYIENRTGAARDYGISFLGLRVGVPTSQAWTVV